MKAQKQSGIAPIAIILIIVGVLFVGGMLGGLWFYKNYSGKDISEWKQMLKTTPAPQPTTQDETTDWKIYRNEKYGFEISYPGNCFVDIANSDTPHEFIQIYGESLDNQYSRWPAIEISQPRKIPEGINVEEWVLNDGLPPYDSILGQEITIDDFESVHLISERSPQAYAHDEFYFIKDNQLYKISIIHTNDKQDWNLYNKILESFRFID